MPRKGGETARPWGWESEAAGRAVMGLNTDFRLYFKFLTSVWDNESLKHYSKLTVKLTLFLERSLLS